MLKILSKDFNSWERNLVLVYIKTHLALQVYAYFNIKK
jgi:hypothetical protein